MAPKPQPALLFQPASTSADAPGEDIPPLAFEAESEVCAVLDRLKEDLRKRVEAKLAGEGGGKGKGKARGPDEAQRKSVEELVLKQFYAKVESIILSNCTIAGHSWSTYQQKKKKGELAKTQPLDDTLHQRVLKYQNDLFDAREVNARERVDAPARTAEYVRSVLELDEQHLAKLEEATLHVPEELPTPRAPRSRKSVGGAAALEAPAPLEAQEYYEEGRQALDRLLAEVPRLTTAAEEATKVAVDAAALR
ncbi:hypothetical protein JCM6882_004330 [Rhodosporidiobolus microsporus]